MKLAYIAEINSKEKNAPQTHIIEIARNLKEFSNEVRIIIPNNGKINYKKDNMKITYIGLRYLPLSINYLLFNFLLAIYLLFLIVSKKINAIYTRQGSINLIPPFYSRIFRLPYFTEINGNLEEEMIELKRPNILIKISNFVEYYSYITAKKIFTVTPNLKKYIVKKYNLNANKIFIIENGVNPESFRPLNKEWCKNKLSLDTHINYLCYVGNFAPWQGLETLIKSFKKVGTGFNNTKLLLVGDGKLRNALLNIVNNLRLQDRIIFVGEVDHKLIPIYIGASDICIAPFTKKRNERMGSSAFKMYEYASCGRPIITTHPDFVSKNKCGLCAKADDTTDIAKKIIFLIRNVKLQKELGRRGRMAIVEGYSWKRVAGRLNKIIKAT